MNNQDSSLLAKRSMTLLLQLDIKLSIKLYELCITTYMNNAETRDDIYGWFSNDLGLWMNNDKPLNDGGYNNVFLSYVMRHYSFGITKNNRIRNKVYKLATQDLKQGEYKICISQCRLLWSLLNAQEKLTFYKYIALQYGDMMIKQLITAHSNRNNVTC